MGKSTPAVSTVTNKVDADPTTKAWQQALMGIGQTEYGKGPAQYYPGQTFAPYSSQTQQGLGMLERQAQAGAPGYEQAQMAAQRNLSGFNPASMYAANFASGNTGAQQQMQQYASGSINPYIDNIYNAGAGKITDAVNSQFAKAGRFGANAAYGNTLGKSHGDFYNSIAFPAFESAQQRGMQATGMLNNSQMAGAGMYGDLYAQSGTQAMQQQQLMPSLYEYGNMPAQQMIGVGGAYEQMNQAMIDDARARWDFNQNAGWENAQRYANLMNGMPDFSGSTGTTTQTPSTNRGMSMFGGAMSGAGAGFQMGGPWGAAIGAGLGLIGGGMK